MKGTGCIIAETTNSLRGVSSFRFCSAPPPPCITVSRLHCTRVQADVRAREQQIRAHAQSIVLTENAVGFENGGQCVSSNRETYPLYVSKAARKDTTKSLVVENWGGGGLHVHPCALAFRAFLNSCVCVKNMVLFLAL